ncbi:MAG TPA: HD domain-containing phosphohydrolase [Candidatus Humimicrobiaceae bacterium]
MKMNSNNYKIAANNKVNKFKKYCKCISKISNILLTVKDEQDLFQKICDLLIETVNYKLVWIGLIKDKQFEVKPVAQSGFKKDYLSSIKITYNDSQYGKGPTGEAIKTHKPSIMKNIKEDPAYKPWRKEALKRGYLSSIAVPLIYKNDVIGVLNIYSEKADDFNGEDVNFLMNIARKIAIGIKTLESEKLLLKSEKRFKNLIELLPETIFETDIRGKIIYLNKQGYKKSGYSRTDIDKGLNVLQVLIPEDRERARINFQWRLQGKEIGFKEYTAQRKDGAKYICYTGSNVIKDDTGKITSIISASLDVTKLRELEKKIFQSEQEKSAILNSLEQPILYRNKEMKILWTNKAAKEIFNLDLKNIKDHKCYEILHNRNKPIKDCPVTKAIKTGKFQKNEIATPDKKIYLVIGYPVKNGAGNTTNAIEIFIDLTDIRESEKLLKESYGKIEVIQEEIIKTLSSIIELRDPYTSGHQQKVAYIAASIAIEMGLDKDTIRGINTAAIIHDIGKINIPASILTKPGKITELEYDMIKTHSETGYNMLKNIDFPWPIAKIVLQHHERLDGSGYPQGLKDKNIILEDKILAVADVLEAMTSHRPYRPALELDLAIKELEENKGILYDSGIVDICITLIKKGIVDFHNLHK